MIVPYCIIKKKKIFVCLAELLAVGCTFSEVLACFALHIYQHMKVEKGQVLVRKKKLAKFEFI